LRLFTITLSATVLKVFCFFCIIMHMRTVYLLFFLRHTVSMSFFVLLSLIGVLYGFFAFVIPSSASIGVVDCWGRGCSFCGVSSSLRISRKFLIVFYLFFAFLLFLFCHLFPLSFIHFHILYFFEVILCINLGYHSFYILSHSWIFFSFGHTPPLFELTFSLSIPLSKYKVSIAIFQFWKCINAPYPPPFSWSLSCSPFIDCCRRLSGFRSCYLFQEDRSLCFYFS